MFNKAVKYLNNNRYEKAMPLFKKLAKDTPYKEVLLNLGTCYRMAGDDATAKKYYLQALDPKMPLTDNTFVPVYPEGLNNLALIEYTYERDEAAREMYLKALEVKPLYYDALWNLGNCMLRQYCSNKYSRLDICWDLYEYRFKRSGAPVVLKSRKKDLIAWTGEPVDSLVVLVEQGFGDQLMFGRYLSLLESRAKKIWIQCAPRARVFFDKYNLCEDPDETDATHGIGICSLGRIFNSNIPEGKWLHYVPKVTNSTLDIGVTWSGNPDHVNDRYRSTTANAFRPFSDYGNLYTLNPTEANTRGFTTLDSDSWADTVRELSKLDLVITVDTSIAHLCGAVGMPCWVLMPLKNGDFRWGDSSMGRDNVWYDSVRVFRNPGNWDVVIREVCGELKNLQDSVR